jgi:hypothetical protein
MELNDLTPPNCRKEEATMTSQSILVTSGLLGSGSVDLIEAKRDINEIVASR